MVNFYDSGNDHPYSMKDGSYDQLRGLGVGFTGAHRTGKTTLARKLAEDREINLVTSIAGNLIQEMGLSPTEMSWPDRIHYQAILLRRFENFYKAQTEPFMTDRTPLCLATYLLMDLPPVNHPEIMHFVNGYVEHAMRLTQRYFVTVGLVQPGIKYVEEEGKPAFDSARQEKFNFIMRGLITDDRLYCDKYIIPREMTDLEERADFAHDEIAISLKAMKDSWGTLPSA